MKKKILGAVAVIAIAAVASFNMNINNNDELSAISLANVEAIAQSENGGAGNNACYKGSYDSTLPVALKCSISCDQYDRVGGEVDKC
ncbi:NVEALA domain-containing protein [Sphingobacterium sp. UT-1RO-CII-1]|uniref:NVEALA domain-containing protein n=1 Tax=Sphingobacterium sp. UT-1RO-CII-1 TaxID=2995225 RepID=UPI00227CA4DC|nr:NVEALA domain-containing protein [Sphingobacterium sp. UT-1RO-CII-1]MCY4778302.1 NVEALA domain-containing protein [Sphingobacterium sp. UT-1RO-CII-1]